MQKTPLTAAVLAVALCGLGAASAAPTPPKEDFAYDWTLRGFKGAVARLFVPGRGEGRLTTESNGDSILVTELRISAGGQRSDEFWAYGAEIDPERRQTLKAWSAQRFRGESRRRERDGRGIGALDLASSIYFLRQELPESGREADIWSSGQVHPVSIRPTGRGAAVVNGVETPTRSYRIKGVKRPGRPVWKGQMDLVLTADEAALPLEIVVVRKGMRIRLALVDPQ